jgi:hypothetical protein
LERERVQEDRSGGRGEERRGDEREKEKRMGRRG